MNMQVTNYNHFNFMVACCKKKHVFALEEVIRLEASSNYTLIHTVNKRPLMVAKVLAAYEEILEGLGFIRVHRSHLVNRQYVKKLDSTGVMLQEGLRIEVPRRKRKEVLRRLTAA
jgi:two-component system LytT family response regulator